MDYTAYLPDIDVADGKARVMGNMKLYVRLLSKFDGAKMAGAIIDAVEAGETKNAAQAAHALRGTAANLGFPVVRKITEEMELLSKDGKDCKAMVADLNTSVAALTDAIQRVLAEQS
jgi:hypothetical protein